MLRKLHSASATDSAVSLFSHSAIRYHLLGILPRPFLQTSTTHAESFTAASFPDLSNTDSIIAF